VVEENQAGRPLRLDDLLLLNQLWLERHLAVSEASFVIQKPVAEARSILERLIERLKLYSTVITGPGIDAATVGIDGDCCAARFVFPASGSKIGVISGHFLFDNFLDS
jgi:hypothetical protein